MTKINFEQLIHKFIEKVNEKKETSDSNKSIIISIKKLNLDLLDLVKNIHIFPKCFFAQKNSDLQYLGLGIHRSYMSHEQNVSLNLDIQTYPEFAIMGGKSFFDDDAASEWKDFSNQYFFMPKIQFKREDHKIQATIIYDKSEIAQKEILIFLRSLLKKHNKNIFHSRIIKANKKNSYQSFENYANKAISNINKNSLKKVVIARKETRQCDSKESIRKIITDWDNKIHNHYYFLLQTNEDHAFLSVTPERLFLLENKNIMIDSIAGTRPRSNDSSEDNQLSNELLADKKEIQEHEYVSKSIENSLLEHAKDIQKTKNKEILKLKNVQHIFSQFKARANDSTNSLELLKEFHPTPAVGGFPKETALHFIKENEDFTRGLYAAPIGILSKTRTDLAVGIRSVLISHQTAHIYAGCGIVENSVAQNEWHETQNKMDNFSNLL